MIYNLCCNALQNALQKFKGVNAYDQGTVHWIFSQQCRTVTEVEQKLLCPRGK